MSPREEPPQAACSGGLAPGSSPVSGNLGPDGQVSGAGSSLLRPRGPGPAQPGSASRASRPSPATVRPVCQELLVCPRHARCAPLSGLRSSDIPQLLSPLLETPSIPEFPHQGRQPLGTPSAGSRRQTLASLPGAGEHGLWAAGCVGAAGSMSGNAVGRVHGNGLNGAEELYYEAVEGSQNPGGLLLSPAAFINPAQYASVLEGRFKQLQGECPRAEGSPVCQRGPGTGGTARAQKLEPTLSVTQMFVLGDNVTSLRGNHYKWPENPEM